MNTEEAVRKFVQLVLFQAQKDDASDVAIAVAEGDATPVRYKVKGQWYDMAPPPAHLRTAIVEELARLAKLPKGPFPKKGSIDVSIGEAPSKWELAAPTTEGEWILTRVVA